MDHPCKIVGTWRIPSRIATGKDEFMYVGVDGRIVHFVFADSGGSRVQAMKLWFDSLGEDRYRVRGIPGHAGWVVGLIPTASGMTIQREEQDFLLTLASNPELPEWYPARLERALSDMSKSEADHKEAEQSGTSDGDNPPI